MSNHNPLPEATDWDTYYTHVPATAKLTRRYTTSALINAIETYGSPGSGERLSIIELGGANSCFLDAIVKRVAPASYDVVDTNEYGLNLLAKRPPNKAAVRLHRESVLGLKLEELADVAFSAGLIEHFDPEGTRRAIFAHFDVVRPGGIAIITFPTPTVLYQAARSALEFAGLWKFPDERPLRREEVVATVEQRGVIVREKLLWPLILTQHMIVARKAG